ncbi:MAG: HypC/HybG/HupF family hydrogenase formation chaperone [Deltaproteobacteria bacterium]|nr:HypC/HybG/HupF family hydrogenase formation chaperone [Deltaproteobacteria bacterium]
MCLVLPAQILEVKPDGMGVADHAGARRNISLLLLDDVQPGDYVILHAGFAIHKIDEQAAKETLEYLSMLATQIPGDYDPNKDF